MVEPVYEWIVSFSPLDIFEMHSGMNFSGCCRSPKAFITFITISGTPYVLQYDWQIISAADLEAEYGLDGLCGSLSLNACPSAAEP